MRTLLFLTLCGTALAQPNEPVLSLAVNGSAQSEAFLGSPLVLEFSVLHARTMKTDKGFVAISIAAREGGWPNALEMRITNQSGQEQTWPLVLTTPSSSPLTLDGSNAGELTWVVKPEDTRQIVEGTYELVVTLDSAKGAVTTGWSGRKPSVPVTLRISAEQSPLPDEQAVRKNLLLAQYWALMGDPKQAMAALGKALEIEPGNALALESKGDLLAEAGDEEGALEAYGQALKALYRDNAKPVEPPSELFQKQNALLNKWLNAP